MKLSADRLYVWQSQTYYGVTFGKGNESKRQLAETGENGVFVGFEGILGKKKKAHRNEKKGAENLVGISRYTCTAFFEERSVRFGRDYFALSRQGKSDT